MTDGSKRRIELAAAEMLARDGYHGMGLKAISVAAGLPYGSIYHHFPGGKEEIAVAAIDAMGIVVGELIERIFVDGVTPRNVRQLFSFMADRLELSEWTDGCPIGTPALDGSADSDGVRFACDKAFDRMVEPIVAALIRQGVARRPAVELATAMIASYEGATVLARARRTKAPLRAAAEMTILAVLAVTADI